MVMSQTVNQQVPPCERCGGTEFRPESGYFFCAECQLQSQDIQEHVLDGYYAGTAVKSRKVKKTDEQKEASAQQLAGVGKKYVSSVELLNYVLKKLVDQLILLGASKRLKIITLQLWASYLRKLELAFTSKSVRKKPKVGVWYKQGDVARFYKVRNPVSLKDYPKLVKRTRKARSTKSGSTGSGGTTTRSKKRRLALSKASLARAEYEESCGEGSINMSSLAPSLASLDLSAGSQSSLFSSTVDEKVQYSKRGKEELEMFMDQINKGADKMEVHKRAGKRSRMSIHNPRASQIVTILRIALILSGSDIHFGDLLRWSDEGYFSYITMKEHVPPEIHFTTEQRYLFTNMPRAIETVCKDTAIMVKFLSVKNIGISPSALISNLVKRYCKILNLPDNLPVGIDELLKQKPPKMWLDSAVCNYEGRAMAFIMFSLKILIGLDGVTEYTYVPRKGVEGVKWEDWCNQYEARMAEKALHHYPTLARHYPNCYIGRNHSFLSHWGGNPRSGRGYTRKNDHLMMECYKNELNRLACKLPEPTWRPGLEHECKPTGPPLAVLSEPVDGKVRTVERSFIIEPPVKRVTKVLPDQDRELNVRIYNDDADVKIKTERNINKPAAKKISENEDYSVWMNHNMDFRGCFVEWRTDENATLSKFPDSFWWLLKQMAGIVHQTPFNIYHELVKVEKMYSGTSKKQGYKLVW